MALHDVEALACGLPVATFPVTGPSDVVTPGVLDNDLRTAALAALELNSAACRAEAERHSWARSAQEFMANLVRARKPLQAATCNLSKIREVG